LSHVGEEGVKTLWQRRGGEKKETETLDFQLFDRGRKDGNLTQEKKSRQETRHLITNMGSSRLQRGKKKAPLVPEGKKKGTLFRFKT